MRACIKMIRNMVSGYILGKMVVLMMATGIRENNMELVIIKYLKKIK